MNENMIIPVGMECVASALSDVVSKAEIYEYHGIAPPHFIVNLRAGNGQTTLTNYITDIYIDYKLKRFSSIETRLEYKLDGSMSQLRDMDTDLTYRFAGYMNEYNGVVSIDVSALSTKRNEPHIPFLVDLIDRMKNSVTFVLFFPYATNGTLKMLLQQIEAKLVGNVVTLDIPAYTVSDLATITYRALYDKGICVVDESKVIAEISETVEKTNIKTAKEAAQLGERLLLSVDYKSFNPVLGVNEIKNFKGGNTYGK